MVSVVNLFQCKTVFFYMNSYCKIMVRIFGCLSVLCVIAG